jgi:hypothetical protein
VRRASAVLLVCGLATFVARAASAQSDPLPGRVEVGGGVDWIGRASMGSSNATETTPSGGSAPIFNTTTSLNGAAGVHANVSVRVYKRLEAEVLASWAKPALETTISNDIEGGPGTTARETITQYTIGGGALWYLPFAPAASKLAWFVDGSAAYLRQLHQGETLVVTGQMYRAGGGVKYLFSSRPSRLKGFGVRADAALVVRVNGVAFGSGALYSPAAGASLFVRF